VLELEGINDYHWDAPDVTVEALAARLAAELPGHRNRVQIGWGIGGVVAHALAAQLAEPPLRVLILDAPAPGVAPEPTEAELLRRFAMFLGARRGRMLDVTEPLERVLAAARAAGVVRADTTLAALQRLYDEHARRELRAHRITQTYEPAEDVPLTVLRAATGGAHLGWDAETFVSGGDHYSMLTDPAAVSHLAMVLRRWFAVLPLAA
jgi:thioesterase domain-containing protein